MFLLSSLTKACKIKNDNVITRLPISKGLLHLILNECTKYFGKERNQLYLESLYRAMFVAVYYGLLRIGEVTLGPHVLLASNVHIGTNKKKILFVLKSSKMHGKGSQPQRIKISSAAQVKGGKRQSPSTPAACPFQILSKYVDIHPDTRDPSEQFFIFRDHKPVAPHHMRTTLRLLISKLGLQPELYNGHSFRIGRGCNMVHMVISVETVKKIGRWKSNTVSIYL